MQKINLSLPICLASDTESLYTVATQNILDPYGKTYTWEVKESLMGMQNYEVACRIVEAYELPITPEEYLELALEQYNILFPNAQLMPGNFTKGRTKLKCVGASLSLFIVADTEKIYLGIIGDVLKQFNKPYPWATRMRVLGTTEQKCCQIIVEDLQLPVDAKEFHRRYTDLCNVRLGDCDLLPGRAPIFNLPVIVLLLISYHVRFLAEGALNWILIFWILIFMSHYRPLNWQ